MNTLQAIRKANLLRVISQNGGTNAVSKLLGYKNSAFLSQMTGPNPDRKISEETCRNYETKLGLPVGALDIPVESELPATVQRTKPGPRSMSPDELSELILLVGKKIGDTPLPANKFANLVALSLLDRREEHIDQLVALLK